MKVTQIFQHLIKKTFKGVPILAWEWHFLSFCLLDHPYRPRVMMPSTEMDTSLEGHKTVTPAVLQMFCGDQTVK